MLRYREPDALALLEAVAAHPGPTRSYPFDRKRYHGQPQVGEMTRKITTPTTAAVKPKAAP